jgi:hypothetical protein
LVRVRDARRLTRVPSNLAMFDLRAETMFWAVENPSPSNSKCLDGGFVSYMFVSLSIDSLILGIRARADGEIRQIFQPAPPPRPWRRACGCIMARTCLTHTTSVVWAQIAPPRDV